jgi:hypothetical protein
MGKFDNLTGIDKIKYEMKLQVLHNGPCSSPRNQSGDTACTCPRACPLHGRCCDCIAHHKAERLEEPNPKTGDCSWMPHCLVWFDQRNGVGCTADPEAGSKLPF